MDQSSLASPSNPDMSPNASPLTDHVACVGSPSLREPPSLDEDEISHNLDETLSLTSTDIKADPILRSLAKQQSLTRLKDNAVSISSSANFKARPAPKIVEGAGPRMTKAAALRQGLKWETPKWEKREKEEIVFDQVPGHKRAGLNIAPRTNRSADLRARPAPASRAHSALTSTSSTNISKEEPSPAKLKNTEKVNRRASVVGTIKSLGAPAIAPRLNKAAMLRAPGTTPELTKTTSTATLASPRPKWKTNGSSS